MNVTMTFFVVLYYGRDILLWFFDCCALSVAVIFLVKRQVCSITWLPTLSKGLDFDIAQLVASAM